MTTSQLFNSIMSILWSCDKSEPKEAMAIASYVKTYRINSENALEVIRIMWPNAKFSVRANGEGVAPDTIWFDVQFEDGSQVMVNADDGIGNAIEVVS